MYAKLEGENPTGSIKDRVAKAMIDAAEAAGELQPGRELLEPTSGNTGISLALIAKLKGYPLTCVMPANATEERRKLLRLYGAEIVESPAEEGSNGAVRLALELAAADPRWFMPFQYGNEANPRAHYEGTGAEIAEALDRVDVLVAGLGTGGTLMGTGARLRESFPDLVVAAAEPLPGDPVMGLRSLEDGYVPPILDVTKLDRKVLVPAEIRRALEEHARAEAPNEACGLVLFREGVAERYEPGSNAAASPYRFELSFGDPEVWFAEDDGYELAVFHSHLSAPARPSRTDVENIGLWERKPYVILSLRTRNLAAFRIEGGQIEEIPLTS